MSAMPSRTLAWIVLVLLLLAVGLRLQALFSTDSVDTLTREQNAYRLVHETIRERYVSDHVDEKKLFYGALEGMAGTLDQHTQFIPPDDYDASDARITGELEGVGMEIERDSRGIFVVTPWIGTPAYAHGVLPGDRLQKIDGISTQGMDVDEARKRITGKAGSEVRLTLLHEGEEAPVELALIRAAIVAQSIPAAEILSTEWVPDPNVKIGFIQIAQFQKHTAVELDADLKKLEALGMQALILDLRQNRGGMLDAATGVAELFLKDGPIVSVFERSENGRVTQEDHVSSGTKTHPDYPLVILTDALSASASEIVSGALRERGRAVLVGDRTYGKFSVQTIIRIPISDQEIGALKLTTARYRTPKGKCIDNQGIIPDFPVPSTPEQQKALLIYRNIRHLRDNNPRKNTPQTPAGAFVDAQLKKAVEVVMGKLKKE
jgi:carboxyl-terminal processing protease